MSRYPLAVFSILSLVCTGLVSAFALVRGNASEPPITSAGLTAQLSVESQANGAENRFDPTKLKPGDRFLGLEVVSVEANSLPNYGFIGKARFRGEVTVSGTFDAGSQPDDELGVPCFYVDEASSQQLPRFLGDERTVWFCFNNPEEAKQALGGVRTEGKKVTIVINDYETVYYPSDVYDTATLVRVIRQ